MGKKSAGVNLSTDRGENEYSCGIYCECYEYMQLAEVKLLEPEEKRAMALMVLHSPPLRLLVRTVCRFLQ